MLFSVGCNEDSQVVELATPSNAALELQHRSAAASDAAEQQGELGDNTYAAERASTTAALIESLREGEIADQAFSWTKIADELETMINYYASDVSNAYGIQETILLEYDLGPPSNTNVLDFYENVRSDLISALTTYDNSQVATSIGLQFVAFSIDERNESGTKGYVVANIGEAGSLEPTLMDNDFKWTTDNSTFVNNCRFAPAADREITNASNRRLRGGFRSDIGNLPPRIAPEVRGIVNVAFSAEEPGYARGSVETLDQRGFAAGTTGYNSNLVDCQLAPFVPSGQYRIHYDCNSDEPCFDQSKFNSYLSQYNSIGDVEARNIAKREVGYKFFRIGAYVVGIQAGDPQGSFAIRTHTATYYYGDYFVASPQPNFP